MKKTRLIQQVVYGLSTSSLLAFFSMAGSYSVVQAEELDVETTSESENPVVDLAANAVTDDVNDTNSVGVGESTTVITNQGESEHVQETVDETSTVASDATSDEDVENAQSTDAVELQAETVYMTEKHTMTETVAIGDVDASQMIWTLDGKPLNEFKKYNMETGEFDGDPYITINGKQDGSNYTVQIQSDLLFGEDLSLREPNNIRRIYRDYIGDYELIGMNQAGDLKLSKLISLRPYAAYQSYEELVQSIKITTQQAAKNRYVETQVYGESAKGRPLIYSTVAKDKATIDTYLYETEPLMLENPEALLDLLANKQLDIKVPIMFHNTHADEQPGIDIVYGLFDTFAHKDQLTYNTIDANGESKQVTLNIPELLDKFIFIFSFVENPDGAVDNTRVLANGFDPNRDTSYQMNPETRGIVKLINQWNPLTLVDYHGFVKEFLIEPTTPPHDPNFEYDLTSETMMTHANEMGRAGITNSKYEGYIIPKIDYGSGWDDAFSGYTAVYGLYHGILGHTVEIPETNQDSYLAGIYAGYASANFAVENFETLVKNRLMFNLRGINKIEDPKAEEELVAANGSIEGRIKGDNPTFFPDYYVISMTPDKYFASEEAYEMIAYFERNGVQVKELSADVGDFKKGDLVIDMAQAKRGYANHILYPGMNESDWDAMYAELVVNFPVMRGFNSTPLYTETSLANYLQEVTHTQAPRSAVDESQPYHFIANNSIVAVSAINESLKAGKKVYLTDDGFIVDTETYSELIKAYPLYGEGWNKEPLGTPLSTYKIFSPNNYVSWMGHETPSEAVVALQAMGFDFVSSIEEADVIVLDNDRFDKDILGIKPTIIIGGTALQRLEELSVLPGFDAEMMENGSSNEGLMRANINIDLPLSSGYLPTDYFYSTSGTWIEKIPTGFDKLVSILNKDFFISGWWPGFEQLAGKTMAIDGMYKDLPLFIYAGNPLNRQHPHALYRWISNAIFRGIPTTFATSVEAVLPERNEKEIFEIAINDHPDFLGDKVLEKVSGFSNVSELDNINSEKSHMKVDKIDAIDQLPTTGVEMHLVETIGALLLIVGGLTIQIKQKEVN